MKKIVFVFTLMLPLFSLAKKPTRFQCISFLQSAMAASKTGGISFAGSKLRTVDKEIADFLSKTSKKEFENAKKYKKRIIDECFPEK